VIYTFLQKFKQNRIVVIHFDETVMFINEEESDSNEHIEFDDPLKKVFHSPFESIKHVNDIIMTYQMKLKYLNYLPKPIHIDESRYDLVDYDEFFKRDNRMPLVMVTQFGIFPTKGQYFDKLKKDIRLLEGLENQHIAFFRRTYLTNNEEDNLIILYANHAAV